MWKNSLILRSPDGNDAGGSGGNTSQIAGSETSSGGVAQPTGGTPATSGGQRGLVSLPIPDSIKGTKIDLEEAVRDVSDSPIQEGDDIVAKPILKETEEGKFRKEVQIEDTKQQLKKEGEESKVASEDKSKEDKPKAKEETVKSSTSSNVNTDKDKKTATTDATSSSRDYTKFNAEDAAALKKVSNESFAHFEKILPDLYAAKDKVVQLEKQLSDGGFPQQWHEHPQAYQLHPRYSELQVNASKGQFELDYYKQTLSQMDEGLEIYPLLGYDKNGKPVYDDPRKATSSDKSNAIDGMNAARQYMSAQNTEIQELRGGFQEVYKRDIETAQKAADQLWPWWRDEKAPQQVHVKEMLAKIPESFRHSPTSLLCGLLYAEVQEVAAKLKEATGKAKREENLDKIEEDIEPKTNRGNAVNNVKPSKGSKKYPIEKFDLVGMTDDD